MAEKDQYEKVCKDRFNEIICAIKVLDSRLFHDNGAKSIQTVLNEIKGWQKNYDEDNISKVSFWYWLIPIFVSVLIVVIDKIWK